MCPRLAVPSSGFSGGSAGPWGRCKWLPALGAESGLEAGLRVGGGACLGAGPGGPRLRPRGGAPRGQSRAGAESGLEAAGLRRDCAGGELGGRVAGGSPWGAGGARPALCVAAAMKPQPPG